PRAFQKRNPNKNMTEPPQQNTVANTHYPYSRYSTSAEVTGPTNTPYAVCQPRRIKLMAMAARRRAINLETPRKPCLPIQPVKRSALHNATATSARFTKRSEE